MKDPVLCAAEEFGTDLKRLADLRGEILGSAEQLEIATHALLQREAKRIETKLGPSHPRAVRLNARLESSLPVARALEVERQVYRVVVPEVGEKGALVHGRTVDEQGRGIGELLVCLLDSKGTPLRETTDARTDESGYFAHALELQVLQYLQERHEDGVFLGVFTPRENLVYRSRKALALEGGARLFAEIVLNRRAVADQNRSSPPGGGETEPQVVVVPDIIGLSEGEAAAALKRARLRIGDRGTEAAPDSGKILEQDPTAETKVPVGTAVGVVIGVSETEGEVKVPRVTNIKLSSARSKLSRYNLALGELERRPSEKVDIVLEQDPSEGERVAAGTAVNVVVGASVRPTARPSLG